MHKRIFTCLLFLTILFIFSSSVSVHAETDTEYTQYKIRIEDNADLLTDTDETLLHGIMSEIADYGNVAFISHSNKYSFVNGYISGISTQSHSTAKFAEQCYRELFGYESGTLFLIDMCNREIYIFSDGYMYNVITSSYAYTITDNVYTYASNGNYYTCARMAYDQILSLLKGQRIAQPMKYISNTLLSITLALLINYFIVMIFSKAKVPSRHELIENTEHYCLFNHPEPRAEFRYQTKKYSPQSSDSGGSSGGGGGGGSSGGGGGHSF